MYFCDCCSLEQGNLITVEVSHGNISKFTISRSDKSSAVQGRVLLHPARIHHVAHGPWADNTRPLYLAAWLQIHAYRGI